MRLSSTIVCIGLIITLSAYSLHKTAKPYIIQYPAYFGNRIFVPDDNPETDAGVALGRMLFYENALSANNKISCATCHKQELAFTDEKKFSSGFDDSLQPRNTMSLVNLLWVRNFFWDGRATGLEEQAKTPLTGIHEMGQSLTVSVEKLQQKKFYHPLFKNAFGSDTIGEDMIVKALAQFVRTLVSADSKYDKYLRGEYKPTQSELNGIALFYAAPDPANNIRGADCGHCHGGPKTYSELYQNNGLDSVFTDAGREQITHQSFDEGRFRVVTLRNIALTSPYMHDGRFKTLDEVINHYNEHVLKSSTLSPFLQNKSNIVNGKQLDLNQKEKKDIVAFLNMLTDSSFITNKNFSNPFLN